MPEHDSDTRSNVRYARPAILGVVASVGVLGLLGISVPIVDSACTTGDLATVRLSKLEQTIELYKLDNGRYPTQEQGLAALVTAPTQEPLPRRYPPKGYVKRADLLDPWGVEYRYVAPGVRNRWSFDLSSFGPDKVQGGEGDNADIGNWDLGSG